MNENLLYDPALNPPGRADFRRVGKGIPLVKDPETGKMVRRRRSSSVGKVLDDESNLTDWKLRTVLVGAAQLPEVLAVISTLDPERDKKVIRDYVEECVQAGKGNKRRVQGQAVHSMFDHVDLEHDWEPAPQFKAAVQAYVDMLELYGLEPVDVEVQCVNDQHGLAGTMDRRYRTTRQLIAPDGQIIPIGSILVGDTKTGLSLEYAAGTYATQIAAYVDSVRYDVLTDERIPFDPPTYPDWALVVHAVPEAATCQLYWVDVQQGRLGLQLAQQVYEWRRQKGGLLSPAVAALRLAPEPPTEPQEPSEPAQGTPATPAVPGVLTDLEDIEATMLRIEVKEWLRTRVGFIKEHSDVALQHLARKWPEGVPGLKADVHTNEQLVAIDAVIRMIETEYSLTFPEPDPRELATRTSRDRHPSSQAREHSDRWAKPEASDPTPSDQIESLKDSLVDHPRNELLRQWTSAAVLGSIGQPAYDRYALVTALSEFGKLGPEFTDEQVTELLIGTLNAMGYPGGLADLGRIKPEEAPAIMSAVFALHAGTAMLLFDMDDRPVVRFNIQESKG